MVLTLLDTNKKFAVNFSTINEEIYYSLDGARGPTKFSQCFSGGILGLGHRQDSED